MTKSITPLTIDEEIKRKAKEKGINMSQIAENAIAETLGKVEVNINQQVNKCEFCGREEEKATRNNLEGLSWIWPDEKWICSKCLNKSKVSICK